MPSMAGRFATEVEDELDLFDAEAMFDDGLDSLNEVERRAALEGKSRIAAHIAIDLQDKGPLYQYVQVHRQHAVAAIKTLVTCAVTQVGEIAAAQAAVQNYCRAVEYIHSGLREGELIEQQIIEEYGHGRDDGDGGQDGDEPAWRRRG